MKTVFGHLAIKAKKKKLLIVRVKANKNTMIIFFPYLVYLSKEYSLSHSWGTETKIK